MREPASQTRSEMRWLHVCIRAANEDVVLMQQLIVRSGRSVAPRLRVCEPYFGVARCGAQRIALAVLWTAEGPAATARESTADAAPFLHPSLWAQLRTLKLTAAVRPHSLQNTVALLQVVYLTIRDLATPGSLGVVLPSLSPITLGKQGHLGRS